MGGIQLGDQFRVTAELFESDAWGKGASGDYSVMLKAKDGADDLLVFVEESDADEWTDGTKVEMVLETVEVTISGETTDGWLKARSVKTFSGITSKEEKEAASGADLLKALKDHVEGLNGAAGATVIDSIENGSTRDVYYINLNLMLASATTLEAQTLIRTINQQLVDRAKAEGAGTVSLKYYLAGSVVAENRRIMDPSDVSFKGVLDN